MTIAHGTATMRAGVASRVSMPVVQRIERRQSAAPASRIPTPSTNEPGSCASQSHEGPAPDSHSAVRLYSRPGNDLTSRFPLIVEALARLRSRSCIIDGEAVVCGDDGIASFDRIR